MQLEIGERWRKGRQNGWDRKRGVLRNVRHPGERFVPGWENEWPLQRTRWTPFYLDPDKQLLSRDPVTSSKTITYDAMGEGVTFSTPPLKSEMEITGPSALKLFISASTRDADLFAVLRLFDPPGREVVFQG